VLHGVTTPNVKSRTFRNVAKTYRQPKAKCNTFLQRDMLAFSVENGSLQKRSMPLKNSLPEAFSALILVFSNQDGEYLWLPLLLSRALSAV